MEGFEQVVALQSTVFPPEESYSINQILELCTLETVLYKSFWNRNRLCGLLFFNVGRTMVYLFYLAVCEDQRSKGLGTSLLCWLKERYPDKSIVANIEPVGFNAANEAQREMRYAFYRRNGFRRLSWRMCDSIRLYDIISASDFFDSRQYMEMILELGFGANEPRIIPG
ncbi:MAG: GNAT family N-acetyltransferase [Bacteroidales bacterium]|nr:GNAT family N-acetyltransferase [Bacteroidales bacterium]